MDDQKYTWTAQGNGRWLLHTREEAEAQRAAEVFQFLTPPLSAEPVALCDVLKKILHG